MLRNVFGRYGRIAYGPFPRVLASADTMLRLPRFDTTAAKALLDSAGWRAPASGAIRLKNGKPLRFALMYPTSSLPRARYAVLLQQQLRTVGAQVDIEALEPRSGFYPRWYSGDFDAAVQNFNTDPSVGGAKQTWATEGIGPNGQNALAYSNSRVDALLDSAVTTFDAARAKGYASRAYQAIVDDAPAIWLYDQVLIAGAHRRIVLAPTRADGWWSDLPDWSVPRNARIDRDRIGLTRTAP